MSTGRGDRRRLLGLVLSANDAEVRSLGQEVVKANALFQRIFQLPLAPKELHGLFEHGDGTYMATLMSRFGQNESAFLLVACRNNQSLSRPGTVCYGESTRNPSDLTMDADFAH